jgi:hypothetical protein
MKHLVERFRVSRPTLYEVIWSGISSTKCFQYNALAELEQTYDNFLSNLK